MPQMRRPSAEQLVTTVALSDARPGRNGRGQFERPPSIAKVRDGRLLVYRLTVRDASHRRTDAAASFRRLRPTIDGGITTENTKNLTNSQLTKWRLLMNNSHGRRRRCRRFVVKREMCSPIITAP